MNIGILGSGMVGQAIAEKLVQLGHQVKVGTRDSQKLSEWLTRGGKGATVDSFSEAAAFGEILFHATAGHAALDALHMAGAANLNSKVLIDISNPLDFSHGFPPSLTICNTDSLGEQIQREFPTVKVVKTLNTCTAALMVNPTLLSGDHVMFLCGNDTAAKSTVIDILQNWFGWKSLIDLGDITNARATEMLLPIWVRLYGVLQTGMFNFNIVRQETTA